MQTSYSDTRQLSPSNGTRIAARPYDCEQQTDGSLGCTCTRETFGCSIHPNGRDEWIASMRASLARILASQDAGPGSAESEAGSSARCSGQLTLFALDSCFSKTAHKSEPAAVTLSSASLWRVDTPGSTEYLPRLMSGRGTTGTAGGALLPTLTVCGNWNRAGASPTSGNGLATALRLLPTICATDYKELYSEAGYRRQMQRRSNPLRDTLVHITGHRLTPAFAEWWMGWPLRWTATRVEKESRPPETDKCQSRQRRRG